MTKKIILLIAIGFTFASVFFLNFDQLGNWSVNKTAYLNLAIGALVALGMAISLRREA